MTARQRDDRSEPLPSLNALLAFEAAARHASFTRAARELGVTQTAVSHQIRALELSLETPLFQRTPRGICLTVEGERWAAELSVVFTRLREANARLRRPRDTTRPAVSVSIVPSFGTRWLVPRLGRFLATHPEIDVRISATERVVDLTAEPIDIGIRYGSGRYPGLVASKLTDDAHIVVAAPALAGQHDNWRLTDLSRETLLADDHPDAWRKWFRARARELPADVRQSEFSDSSMLVEAAVRGQGVGLARWSLALDELALGRLVLLFPKLAALPTGLAYYVVSSRASLRREPVSAFRDWVLAEARDLSRSTLSIPER
jgi:LysR family transcriptional regulator, glycine cleavage system transcriptional activator